jgi:hypothetical protein
MARIRLRTVFQSKLSWLKRQRANAARGKMVGLKVPRESERES